MLKMKGFYILRVANEVLPIRKVFVNVFMRLVIFREISYEVREFVHF
jgi:hypothetical protein